MTAGVEAAGGIRFVYNTFLSDRFMNVENFEVDFGI